MTAATPICRMFERQEAERAFSRACAKTGKRIAARMAIIAMTTSSSISVKPGRLERRNGRAFCSISDPPSRLKVRGFDPAVSDTQDLTLLTRKGGGFSGYVGGNPLR